MRLHNLNVSMYNTDLFRGFLKRLVIELRNVLITAIKSDGIYVHSHDKPDDVNENETERKRENKKRKLETVFQRSFLF